MWKLRTLVSSMWLANAASCLVVSCYQRFLLVAVGHLMLVARERERERESVGTVGVHVSICNLIANCTVIASPTCIRRPTDRPTIHPHWLLSAQWPTNVAWPTALHRVATWITITDCDQLLIAAWSSTTILSHQGKPYIQQRINIFYKYFLDLVWKMYVCSMTILFFIIQSVYKCYGTNVFGEKQTVNIWHEKNASLYSVTDHFVAAA